MIGVIVASPFEAKSVRMLRSKLLKIRIIEPGPWSARQAAEQLHQEGVKGLCSWGFAAGLDPKLPPGTLVVPETLMTQAGVSIALCSNWRGRILPMLDGLLPVSTGSLLHSPVLVPGVAAKQQLFNQYQAQTLDMESFTIAEYAENRLPCFVIRSIVDQADMALPEAIVKAYPLTNWCSYLQLAMTTLTNPQQWDHMRALKKNYDYAQQTLCHAAMRLNRGEIGIV